MTDRTASRLPRPWVLISVAWIGPAVLAMIDHYGQARLAGEHARVRSLLWQGGDWLL